MRLESFSAAMFKPNVARQQVWLPIGINIAHRHPLPVSKCGAACAHFARKNLDRRPRLSVSGVGRDFGEEDSLCALVPKRKLRFADPEQISEDLIMVLGGSASLDIVAFPGNARLKLREGILPPPDFITLPIAAENEVEISISIDIVNGAAGFNCQKVCLDNVTIPT